MFIDLSLLKSSHLIIYLITFVIESVLALIILSNIYSGESDKLILEKSLCSDFDIFLLASFKFITLEKSAKILIINYLHLTY